MRFNFVLISRFLLVPVVLASSWGGANVEMDDGAFNYVMGNFTAPKLLGDLGSGIVQQVVIDQNKCHTSQGSLSSGIVSTITNGVLRHQVFLDWHPNAMMTFGDISTGDIIHIKLSISDPSTASLSFENSNGHSFRDTFQSSTVLCGAQAGWMIGSATENDFPVFDSLSVMGAAAGIQGGPRPYIPFDGKIYEVEDPAGNGHPDWTHTTARSDASLNVAYVPVT